MRLPKTFKELRRSFVMVYRFVEFTAFNFLMSKDYGIIDILKIEFFSFLVLKGLNKIKKMAIQNLLSFARQCIFKLIQQNSNTFLVFILKLNHLVPCITLGWGKYWPTFAQ